MQRTDTYMDLESGLLSGAGGPAMSGRGLRRWSSLLSVSLLWPVLLLVVLLLNALVNHHDASSVTLLQTFCMAVAGLVFPPVYPWASTSFFPAFFKALASQSFQVLFWSCCKHLYEHRNPETSFPAFWYVGVFAMTFTSRLVFDFMWTLFPRHYWRKYAKFLETYEKWKQNHAFPVFGQISYGATECGEGRRQSGFSTETLQMNGDSGPIPIQDGGLSLAHNLYSVSPKNTLHFESTIVEKEGLGIGGGGGFQYEGPDGTKILFGGGGHAGLSDDDEDGRKCEPKSAFSELTRLKHYGILGNCGSLKMSSVSTDDSTNSDISTTPRRASNNFYDPMTSTTTVSKPNKYPQLHTSRSLRSLRSQRSFSTKSQEHQSLKHKLSQYTFGKNSICSGATLRDEPRSIADSCPNLYQAFIENYCDEMNFAIDPSFEAFGIPGFEISRVWVLAYLTNMGLSIFSGLILWCVYLQNRLVGMLAAVFCIQVTNQLAGTIVANRYHWSIYGSLVANLVWFGVMIYSMSIMIS